MNRSSQRQIAGQLFRSSHQFHTWLVFVILIWSGCASYPPLETVQNVDIERYLGKWYEIASVPVSQQEGCRCTTAEYTILEPGVLRVLNRCRKEGELSEADGKAFVVEGSGNAKLRVQFFWPFRGDYWIIALDREYRYAVVGVPSRKYFWILSRTPVMKPALRDSLAAICADRGFDLSKMQITEHTCDEPQH